MSTGILLLTTSNTLHQCQEEGISDHQTEPFITFFILGFSPAIGSSPCHCCTIDILLCGQHGAIGYADIAHT